MTHELNQQSGLAEIDTFWVFQRQQWGVAADGGVHPPG